MDRGDIVLGWLTRVTLVLGVVGVLGYDAVALAVTRVSLEQHASDAAQAAAAHWRESHDAVTTYGVAEQEVLAAGADTTIVPGTFAVGQDGSVSLTVQRVASTLVLQHVPRLREAITLHGDGRAQPAP